jgi:hypothetical protein
MLARLARDLPGFLRSPVPAGQVADLVRRRLAERTERFLALADRAVFARPESPYGRLMRLAGCERGDLEALVDREGLEGALRALAERGVRLSFDEFKGRRPIVRGSATFTAAPGDFDLQAVTHHFRSQTGGSGGPPAVVQFSLAFMHEMALTHAATLHAHGLARPTEVFWLTVAFIHALRSVRAGFRPVAWFHPQPLPWKVRNVARLMRAAGAMVGCRLPPPAPLDQEAPERLAQWLADRRDGGETDVVTATASGAVRVATAAREAGRSLEGVSFIVLGEAFTPAKRAALTASGARPIVTYGCMEGPSTAYACATPSASDDCHVFTDAYAVIQRPRAVGPSGVAVDALLVTALRPSAPKLLLNLEVGDHAVLEERECGCALGALGLRTHLAEIRSHEKLTGEGVTFARSGLIRVLEEVLPARFGGAGTDYQVVEDEDEAGILRLQLLVSPRLGAVDEAAVARAVLAELGRSEPDRLQADLWARAGTMRVVRRAPFTTSRGKIPPFHRRVP